MTREQEELLNVLFSESLAHQTNNLEKILGWNNESRQTMDILDKLTKAIPPMQPNAEVKQKLMSTISHDSNLQGFANRLSQLFDITENQIAKILEKTKHAPGFPWCPMDGSRIFLLDIAGGPRVSAADCGLVYMEPGTQFPLHRHLGDELALILAGEIQEHAGDIKYAGDQIFRPQDSEHSFSVISREPAIIAIVLYKGYQFI